VGGRGQGVKQIAKIKLRLFSDLSNKNCHYGGLALMTSSDGRYMVWRLRCFEYLGPGAGTGFQLINKGEGDRR
jgi:hypothetical protein